MNIHDVINTMTFNVTDMSGTGFTKSCRPYRNNTGNMGMGGYGMSTSNGMGNYMGWGMGNGMGMGMDNDRDEEDYDAEECWPEKYAQYAVISHMIKQKNGDDNQMCMPEDESHKFIR